MTKKETEELLEGIVILFFDILPFAAVVFCAIAASFSATPDKWLIRATCWLIVIVARFLGRGVK